MLTYLVNEVAQYVDRAAMFIVKGTSAIGWYARGIEPADAVKQINVPLSADTVFRIVSQLAPRPARPRQPLAGHRPGTWRGWAAAPRAILAVPLILRDKLAAILYCDTSEDEIPGARGRPDRGPGPLRGQDHRPALARCPRPRPPRPAPASARRPSGPPRSAAGGDEIRERAGVPAPRRRRLRRRRGCDEGSSTVMFKAGHVRPTQAERPAGRRLRPPPARPAPRRRRAVAPEDQKAHEDAKRFARLVVSEIKLYNEAKVNEGRRTRTSTSG